MFNKNIGVMPKGGCPCKTCERKGCGTYHDECPEYLEFRAKVDDVHRKFNTDYDKMARPTKRNTERSPMAITHTHKHRS